MNMQKILDALLEEGLRDGCYPGAAAAVGCRDQVFAISCVGKISENGPKVSEATRYDMASLSKVLYSHDLACIGWHEDWLLLPINEWRMNV